MKRKIILGLFLILSLTACKKEENTESIPSQIEKSEELKGVDDLKDESNEKSNEKKEIKKEKTKKSVNQGEITRTGLYQDVYDRLEGKKLSFSGGSMVEALYFYRDGFFDGVEKGGNGGYISMALYNGRFEITEKLSDSSYRLVLKDLNYDTNTGEEKKLDINGYENTMTYGKSIVMDDRLGESFILRLPETDYAEIPDKEAGMINFGLDINRDHRQGQIGVFALTPEDGQSFVEYKN